MRSFWKVILYEYELWLDKLYVFDKISPMMSLTKMKVGFLEANSLYIRMHMMTHFNNYISMKLRDFLFSWIYKSYGDEWLRICVSKMLTEIVKWFILIRNKRHVSRNSMENWLARASAHIYRTFILFSRDLFATFIKFFICLDVYTLMATWISRRNSCA